jgi:hypothetical protein
MKKLITLTSILAALPACQQPKSNYYEPPGQEINQEVDPMIEWNKRYDKVWNTLLSLEGNDNISPGDYKWYHEKMLDLKVTHNTWEDRVLYLDIMEKDINEYLTKLADNKQPIQGPKQ